MLLFCHGGSCIFGSSRTTHGDFVARLALGCGRDVLAVEYRLAPEFVDNDAFDYEGLAPTFVAVGEVEIPRDAIEAFIERLRAAGIDVTRHLAADMPHNAAIFAAFHPSGAELLSAVVGFVNRILPA